MKFDKAIELDPETASVSLSWRYKGDSLQALGKYENAINAYDKAIELMPGAKIVACCWDMQQQLS